MAADFFKLQFDLEAIEKGDKRFIGGFVSSARPDRQGEELLQQGLDFSHFVKSGFFNDNHDKGAGGVVGVGTAAVIKTNPKIGQPAWYVEGELLKTDRANNVWEVAKALKERNRGLGFSVEGKVLARKGNKIVKAAVHNVAITPNPVNTDTGLEILNKGIGALFTDEEPEIYESDETEKAMSPGGATDSAGMTGGDALRPESLEKDDDKKKKKTGLKNTRVPGDDSQECDKSLSIGAIFDRVIAERPTLEPHTALNVAYRINERITEG